MKKRNVLRIFGVSLLLWGVGVYSVNTRGYASCTPETGLRGLVDKVFFVPNGSCGINTNTGACLNPGSGCTSNTKLSGQNNTGKCTTQTKSGKQSCVCQ